MCPEHVTDATAAEQKPHGTENCFERIDVDQHRDNHRPANEDRYAIFQAVTPAPQPVPRQKIPTTIMLATNACTFLKAARSVSISSGICCVAITSMVIANANAASMKVSSRVIAMPRKRNPPSRGSASKSGGKADPISCALSFIWLGDITAIISWRGS